VCRWIVQNDVFRDQYLRAREAAGFAHADNIVDMVDMIQAKKLEPNAAKVMMDGLKWAAERMAPKHHSPKHNIAHTSPDGSMSPPTRIVIEAADGAHGKD